MKRFLSFLLASVLTLGLFPVHAHAEETEATELIAVETTAPVETVPETEASVDAPVLDSGNDYKSQADYIGNNSTIRSSVGGREYNGSYYTSKDPEDWYYFVLTSKSKVTVSISSTRGWATATIETADGRAYSTGTRELDVGTHYIRVRTTNGDEDTYTLSVSSTAVGGSGGSSGDSGGGSTHTHSYTAKVTKPTCTQRGYTTYTCSCGDSYKKNYTDAKGHTPGSWTVTEDATCAVTGTKTTKCTVCSVTYTESIPLKPHSYGNWVVTTEPTCTKTGVKTQTCSVCGNQKTESVPVIDHSYEWQVTQEATCEKDGKKLGTCTGCGKQITETIPMLGHSFQGGLYLRKAPTATAEGEWDGWCFNCQQYIDGTYPKLDASQTEYIIEDRIIEISHSAFKGNTQLTKIIIPDSVEEIGQSAFSGCTGLTSITIPDSVTRIYSRAFENCTALTSVKFPDAVNELYTDRLFYYCTSLQNVTLPKGCKEIGEYAFTGCESLTSIIIPDGVTGIGISAFSSCENLSSITLPDSVTYSASNAFLYCRKLKEVHISDLGSWCNISYLNDESHPFNATNGNLYLNGELVTNCIIPEGVINIADKAFYNCASLKTVTVPASVASFGGYVFEMDGWTKIDAVYFLGDAPEFQNNALASNVKKAYYPAGNETWTESVRKQADPRGYAEWNPCEHSIENGVCPAPDACKNCGAPVAYTHDYVDATCTKPIICIGCGDIKGKPLGHTEVILEAKAPTCATPGLTEGKQCSVCKTVTAAQSEIPALGHTEVTDPAVAATCTKTGLTEGKHCAVCDTILVTQEIVPAPGHTEVIDEAVEATCITTGLTEGKHCAVCKEILIKQEEIPVTEHEYENGNCTVCGETDPRIANLTRIAGDGRCQTAMEAAEELKKFQGVEKFHTIVVADGNNYPDALSGSYLAAVTDAPILLVQANQKKVTQTVKDYIVGNLTGDGTVYILGGPNSIPADFENSIRSSGFTVKRLAGTDRYSTSLMIVEEANTLSNAPADTLLVCAGGGYADSLSASATGKPVLLVNGTKTSLTSSQKNYLAQAGNPKIYVIGGPNSVSEAILNELNQYGSSVKRIAGNGREETSAAVAYEFFPDATFAVLADGNNYPDGLSGGPVAYAKKAPLLLVRQNREASAKDYVGTRIKNGYILGGPNSVSDKCVKNIFGESCLIK